ncbi:MAG: murein transglycosylase A [Alphaproteobacteria bacterium]|nr:murein transglycosylase A [Alphaproteobacteria bacterium]
MRIVLFFILGILAACAGPTEISKSALQIKPANYTDLPGWGGDDFKTFIPAFNKSCERILKADPAKPFGALKQAGTYGDWQPICRSFLQGRPQNLKAFFEARFTPYQILADNEETGLFTGYYEASLKGAPARGGPYQTPLYQRPDDLVMVQLGEFREDLKGRRIAGRVVDGNLKPYESRPQIVNGNWPHNDKVLVWVDNPVDAFFVQIQGSGVVELAEGGIMRIGYAGQNGHVYYAVGRELIKRGALTKENVSMQSIREWLETNPSEADEIMNTNASYVFFKQLEGTGPVGGEGVELTAGRSLAVDHSLLSYGLPLWADIEAPVPSAGKLQRLLVAQDTGGAIRGPVRGDVFWGYGSAAEALAGPMKSKGRYWALLPKH